MQLTSQKLPTSRSYEQSASNLQQKTHDVVQNNVPASSSENVSSNSLASSLSPNSFHTGLHSASDWESSSFLLSRKEHTLFDTTAALRPCADPLVWTVGFCAGPNADTHLSRVLTYPVGNSIQAMQNERVSDSMSTQGPETISPTLLLSHSMKIPQTLTSGAKPAGDSTAKLYNRRLESSKAPRIRTKPTQAVGSTSPMAINQTPFLHTDNVKRRVCVSSNETVRPGPIMDDEGEEEWFVEQIMGQKFSKHGIKYLVRWSGYEPWEDSWEPRSALENTEALATWLAASRSRRARNKQV